MFEGSSKQNLGLTEKIYKMHTYPDFQSFQSLEL